MSYLVTFRMQGGYIPKGGGHETLLEAEAAAVNLSNLNPKCVYIVLEEKLRISTEPHTKIDVVRTTQTTSRWTPTVGMACKCGRTTKHWRDKGCSAAISAGVDREGA